MKNNFIYYLKSNNNVCLKINVENIEEIHDIFIGLGLVYEDWEFFECE